MKSAIVVAEQAEERRSIAQFIKLTESFSQIHFCQTLQDIDFLLQNSRVDMMFCDVCGPAGSEERSRTATLTHTAARHSLELVFFSHLDPVELNRHGLLPAGSHHLSYTSSPATAQALLQRLLHKERTAHREVRGNEERLLDADSGIYNRFYFDILLDQELSRSKLTGRPFSLLLIEPHSLTTENPPARRSLAPALALTLKAQIRASDLLCRIATGRLALLLPETGLADARRVSNRLAAKVKDLLRDNPHELKFGLASPASPVEITGHDLLQLAEAAL